jgi:hypothetical protein
MVAVTNPVQAQPRRKHTSTEWQWDYHPQRERWETYRAPIDWPAGLWGWLWEHGHPGTDPDSGEYSGWDYHGGWIYIYDKEILMMFKLRWS